MLNTVGMIFTVLLVATVLLLIFDWFRVARLYGGSWFAAFGQMFFTVRKSQSWWILLVVPLSITGTLYLMADPLFRATVPVEIVVPGLISVPLATLLIRLRPPAVLFLGSSQNGQRLYQSIRLRANRYRVIAFLVPVGDVVSVSNLMMDGFRTGRSTQWTQLVRLLVETVPLTVLDTRTATPNVIEEARWLLQPHLRKRAIFVSTDFGTTPALDAVDDSVSRDDLCITTVRDCARAIRNRLRAMRAAPRKMAPGRALREVATRIRFEQIDGDDYLNEKRCVSIRGLNEWTVQDFTSEFEANGGFLALDSPDGSATINLSSGPVGRLTTFTTASGDRSEFLNAWERHAIQRFEEDRRKLGGDTVERLDLTNIGGEEEVLWLEFSTHEGRVGKVCALRQGEEYVLFYFMRRGSSVSIEEILRNWKWL